LRDILRASLAVLRAYFTAELVRSRGLVYGLLSLAVWISVFVVPTTLFSEEGATERVARGVLVGVAVFLAYSTATWDWAMLLRWLVQLGVLEYVLASGSPIISHFMGMIPVSLAWYSIALCIVYAVISLFVGPPRLVVLDPIALAIGIVTLLLVLLAYALLVGGALLTSGTPGPVVELVSWILPLAAGGFFPVRSMRFPANGTRWYLCVPVFPLAGLDLGAGSPASPTPHGPPSSPTPLGSHLSPWSHRSADHPRNYSGSRGI
jgi:ABC-2 type transport system permease protein